MHLRCHPIPNCHEADVNLSCWNVAHKYHAIHMCVVCCMIYLIHSGWLTGHYPPWIMSHERLSGYRQSHHRGLAPGYSSLSMSPVSSIHATPSLKLSFHNGNSIWLLNFIKMSKMLVTNENALWRQWANRNPGDMTLFWSRDTPCKMHRLLLFSPASDTKMFQALLSAFVWA